MVKDSKPNSSVSGKIIVPVVATFLFAVGGFAAWYAYSNLQKQNQVDNTTNQHQTNNPTTGQNKTQQQVNIYLLNDQLEIVPHTVGVKKTDKKDEILASSFNSLLTETSKNTAIPTQTKLIALKVENDGIHVNLSSEFTDGGGSVSMIGRLGQVIYTATSFDNNAQIWINVDGQPLEILGEEGVMVEQPMTRESFDKYFSMSN